MTTTLGDGALWRLVLCLALSLGVSSTSRAQGKTDVVVLTNGDRLTCEVKTLDRGLLEVSTDSMSTVRIEWDDVESVTARVPFEVELASGTRYYGALEPASGGQLAVVAGTSRVVVAKLDVVRVVKIETGFWQRLEGSVDAGGSYTRSSRVGQLTVGAAARARRPAFEWRLAYDSSITIKEGDDRGAGRYQGQFSYTRLLSNRWLLPGFALAERNTDLGFDLRSLVGVGIGRALVQNNHTRLRVAGGISGNREDAVDGPAARNLEALLLLEYAVFKYDFPKVDLVVRMLTFPSLSDAGRLRFNLEADVRREVFAKDLYVSLSLYDDYDNQPRGESAASNDLGISFAFGWQF